MKKWMTYTLGILLTLVVLGAVGLAGYRLGLMQGAKIQLNVKGQPPQFSGPGNNNFNPMDHNFQGNGMPFGDMRRFEHGHRMPFFFPLFGLGRFLIIVLVIGLAYWLYKNSGWRFVPVGAFKPEPAEEKKPKQKSKQ